MPLFDAERHESLDGARWDESLARAAIARIADDAHRSFTEDGLWPIHPLDKSPERADPLKPIYYGAAGVIWTLRTLHDAGLAELRRDYLPAVSRLLEAHRADSVRLYRQPVLGYATGDAGILLLHWRMAPSESLASELHATIGANKSHPSLGFGWGSPSSMLAALFMFEATAERRWSELYLELFEALWEAWSYDGKLGCRLWMNDLYGVREMRLSGLHGWPATVSCMLRGGALLDGARRRELVRRACETLGATATREGPHANWPLAAEDLSRSTPAPWRLQHCIGAPGMVNCLSALPSDSETDALLVAAGELTWDAGPVTKLPSLCHGVPGSGYAFLKLHARTGDERWLERARAFAMHAIGQAERGVAKHGQRKFSLWTGDLGLAMFLADCVRASHSFPTLDVF